MKTITLKLAITISFLFYFSTIYSQAPGCPNLDAGPDQSTDCTNLCVELSANFLETGLTTSYEVSSVPYAPPFPFTGLANPISLGVDDIWSGVIDLPFNFCFFGDTYNQIQVGSNGVIRLEVDALDQSNEWQFNEDLPENLNPTLGEANIFGVAHDIDPSITSTSPEIGWELLGTSPCRTLVVSYSSVAHFSPSCNSLTSTFQMVLYETTNVIEVYVEDKPFCTSWNSGNAVIGIQNNPGTVAFVPPGRNTSDGPFDISNEAWRFTPNGDPNYEISWFDSSGMEIGDTSTINVCPNTDTTYTAEIVYTNCDGEQITLTDDVTVTGTDSPNAGEDGFLDICPTSSPIDLYTQLTGITPTTGGTWTPPMASGTGVFDPAVDPAGVYTYTVTGTNCPDDSANVTVTLVSAPNAGEPGALDVCETDAPIDLFTILGGTPDTGGVWSPTLSSGTSVFTPGTDPDGVYTYTIDSGNGCGNDSAEVTVQAVPLPTISAITTQCSNGTYEINYQTGANISVTASAGTVDMTSNIIFDIPFDTDVVITITSSIVSTCSVTETVTAPDCFCPQVVFDTPSPICIDETGQPVDGDSFPVLETNLDPSLFSFVWSLDGVIIPTATASSLIAENPGEYLVEYTSNTGGTCAGEASVTVNFTEGPESLSLSLTNGLFSSENGILATVTGGSGPYEFSLDNGFYQDSNLFSNVSLGTHTVTVRNTDECGELTATILVIGFPAFFTPNNDGFNDFWNVISDNTIPDMDLFIFDRYGRLLAQIDPNGQGWDGIYNGIPMPGTDYWFVAELKDGSETYRSHFTLRR